MISNWLQSRVQCISINPNYASLAKFIKFIYHGPLSETRRARPYRRSIRPGASSTGKTLKQRSDDRSKRRGCRVGAETDNRPRNAWNKSCRWRKRLKGLLEKNDYSRCCGEKNYSTFPLASSFNKYDYFEKVWSIMVNMESGMLRSRCEYLRSLKWRKVLYRTKSV